MNIFVFSDESGVFDKVHNEYFVYGGVIFLSKEEKDICSRKYAKAESDLRNSKNYFKKQELKACVLKNNEKNKLFRSLNNCIRFGIVIEQAGVLDRIFLSKKDKQRYLDFAYKVGLKRIFKKLIAEGHINPNDVENLYIYADEHTTATNGRYELREGLEQEFKLGTYNWDYNRYFPPIFLNMKAINFEFCNSSKKILIRASDIIANKIYYEVLNNNYKGLEEKGIYLEKLP